jgi:hypothetical protein
MARSRFSFSPKLDTSGESLAAWQAICPLGEFKILPSGSLPPFVPKDLRAKAVDSLLMGSGSVDGYAYYVINLLRPDAPVVDQEPFCLWFSGSVPAPHGCLMHHGSYEERSLKVPAAFFPAVKTTGIVPFLGDLRIPIARSGSLAALSGSTHAKAFDLIVTEVKGVAGHS